MGLAGSCPVMVITSSLPGQVLRFCHTCPRVIEALVNSYTHVRVSEDWVEAVPAEVVQVREQILAEEHMSRL